MNRGIRRLPSPHRALPEPDGCGLADSHLLPDDEFDAAWDALIFPHGLKERLVRSAAAGIALRAEVPFETLPLHGILLFIGRPGVGKTTLAKGLASKLAGVVGGLGEWAFVEIDPHALASSSLGRSQRSVEHLFNDTLQGIAAAGPLAILLDEVETLATDRAALSMDANPIDVHRAVDAALVGLDRLARSWPHVVILATSNFSAAIDPALRSRTDEVVELPLPDLEARSAILDHTIRGASKAFPGLAALADGDVLRRAAKASEGLDGRRLRKALVNAIALRPEANADPNRVTAEDLLAALKRAVST